MTLRATTPGPGRLERLIRRDRLIVLSCVLVVVTISAIYTVAGVGMGMTAIDMTRMARPIGEPMQMGMVVHWTPLYGLLIFLMWWVMMIAMMTPSAAPTLLLYASIKRMGPQSGKATLYTTLFLFGYLLSWALFSLIATAAQWGLEATGLSDGPMMTIRSRGFAGAVMVLAGLYQLSAIKEACLRHCRSPAHFLAEHNRPGAKGALITGADHGLYCLGCCWALMALLFVGGIMNLYWIVGLAIYVAIEKLAPPGRWLTLSTGIALIIAGLLLIADALI